MSAEGEGAEGEMVGCFFVFVCTTIAINLIDSGEAFPPYYFLNQAIATIPHGPEQTFTIAGTLELFL